MAFSSSGISQYNIITAYATQADAAMPAYELRNVRRMAGHVTLARHVDEMAVAGCYRQDNAHTRARQRYASERERQVSDDVIHALVT